MDLLYQGAVKVSCCSVTQSCLTLYDPWTAAHQASLSITNFQTLLKLMSTESVMPSNHLILCCPLLLLPSIFPASGPFPMSQFFTSGGQIIGVSASASVLPIYIQDLSSLGWTGWISLKSKGLSRVFSNTTVQKHQFLRVHITLSTMTKSGKPYPSHLIEFVVHLLIPI